MGSLGQHHYPGEVKPYSEWAIVMTLHQTGRELTVAVKASATCLAADRTWCGGSLGTRWLMTFTQHSRSAGGAEVGTV